MEFEFYYYVIFVSAGFLAGFVDSIAGGGGIITVPVLMASGMPPHVALATNKLQSSFGSFTASLNFIKKGFISLKELYLGVIFTFIGALLGAKLILLLDARVLNKIIPSMLILIFFYTLFNPKFGKKRTKSRVSVPVFFLIFGLLIGFYDGFFGPGTGTFWTIALVTLMGLNLKKATATTKLMNFTSNIVSLGVFIFSGNVLFFVGILMGFGQIAGAFVGSNMVMKRDISFIRGFFLFVVGVTILKLIYDSWLK